MSGRKKEREKCAESKLFPPPRVLTVNHFRLSQEEKLFFASNLIKSDVVETKKTLETARNITADTSILIQLKTAGV
jgi:hypothetical protein